MEKILKFINCMDLKKRRFSFVYWKFNTTSSGNKWG